MMKYISFSAWLLLCTFLTGCEEEMDIDFSEYISDAIVFEGVITNERPPYFFRLSRPGSITEEYKNYYKGIDDAMLVVTDVTAGIRDTMKLASHRLGYGGIFYDYYNYATQRNDSSVVNRMYEPACNGIYVTTKIYGIEGHSYSLDIYHNGKHFKSDVQKMEPALAITELKTKMVDLGEKGKKYAPCISFVNPPGENYFLFYEYPISYTHFALSSPGQLLSSSDNWVYSIVSDEYMEEDVKDFIIDDGENAFGYGPGWGYESSDSMYVWVQTISKSCYDVFDQMIEQLRTDGGAYTPSPTNIKGNISGGVHGCFRVSAASEKGILVERL